MYVSRSTGSISKRFRDPPSILFYISSKLATRDKDANIDEIVVRSMH